jgi:hypothetical protein
MVVMFMARGGTDKTDKNILLFFLVSVLFSGIPRYICQ